MTRKSLFIGSAVAVALAAGALAIGTSAWAHSPGGWGMMGGYGAGYMHGPGMMGYGPGYGYGPGMMGPGYGPGWMHRGGYGPGWMHSNRGYGPGYMHRYGPGYGPDAQRN